MKLFASTFLYCIFYILLHVAKAAPQIFLPSEPLGDSVAASPPTNAKLKSPLPTASTPTINHASNQMAPTIIPQSVEIETAPGPTGSNVTVSASQHNTSFTNATHVAREFHKNADHTYRDNIIRQSSRPEDGAIHNWGAIAYYCVGALLLLLQIISE